MDYFAGSDNDGGDSETSDSDHNANSTGFSTFKLFTGFLIDDELSECRLSNNGVVECHDTEDIGECHLVSKRLNCF